MESRTTRVYRLLGLARRAGALAPGTDAVRRAVREGEARLIIIASDASRVQVAKIGTAKDDRAIPQVILGDRDTLGAAVGLASLSAVAITDGSLAKKLVEELEGSNDGGSADAVEA